MAQEVEVLTCRPIKHFAVVFDGIALLLIIIAVSASNWVDVRFHNSDGYVAWGLWQDCYNVAGSTQVCVSKDWMSACGAFIIIALIACIGAIPLGIFGICTKTRLWYIIAGILNIAAAVCDFIALVIYPSKFSEEIHDKHSAGWNFDWTYGIAWGGLFFMVGAAVLFFLKMKEDTVVQRSANYNPSHQGKIQQRNRNREFY
ncbi:hypothetical protein SNE40_003571 [Patella caerulea]|uniref:Uncharacterized protein n=1 Tax=Patella caerulea TaxID=87958 RepID=A0AAN8KEB7_PATCE